MTAEYVPHRFSGYPGAWCLDCHAQDEREVCVADHDVLLQCDRGHPMCTEHPAPTCLVHKNTSCPEPGSGHFDYGRK